MQKKNGFVWEIVLKRYMSLSQFVLVYFHEVGRTEERAVRLMLCMKVSRRNNITTQHSASGFFAIVASNCVYGIKHISITQRIKRKVCCKNGKTQTKYRDVCCLATGNSGTRHFKGERDEALRQLKSK